MASGESSRRKRRKIEKPPRQLNREKVAEKPKILLRPFERTNARSQYDSPVVHTCRELKNSLETSTRIPYIAFAVPKLPLHVLVTSAFTIRCAGIQRASTPAPRRMKLL
jgi:hypothetical protein